MRRQTFTRRSIIGCLACGRRSLATSEIAMRSLSALWGLLLVWLVYQIASRLFDKRTALIAALFAAINPFLIAYSQEVRMYEQLAALAALLFYGLVRFIMHELIVLPADGTGKTISFSRHSHGYLSSSPRSPGCTPITPSP